MKPRVLHIYKDYYPPVQGGVEKTIHYQCEGLKNEYNISVLVAGHGPATRRERQGDIPVTLAGSWGRFFSAPLCPGFPRLIHDAGADILHFHVPNPTGDLAYLMSKAPGRVVVTYHSDIVRQRWALWAYGVFLKKFLDRADIIMPTSPNYVESSPFLRPLKEKCHVVPLAIPLAEYEKTKKRRQEAETIRQRYGGTPLIIFVGKLRYYKGLHFLLEAMPRINAHLIIIGDGRERRSLEAAVRQSGIETKVTFLGEVSEEEKIQHLHAGRIFCLPAHLRSEAFGICQIEAMACGLPVVSTDLDTGVPFVNRDGETGLTVAPAQPGELADAINRLIEDDELWATFSRNARKRAREHFDIPHMVGEVRKVYQKVLE